MAHDLPCDACHIDAITNIAGQVRSFYRDKAPYRVYHGSTNSTRPSARRLDNIIDISRLNRVLDVRPEQKLAFVEPNVSMDALVAATLEHGLLPPVVMEFPGITAGGGYSGTSGESSSFRHGFFDRTIEMAEIIIGNGEILVASEDKHADLFRGAATSCGTLGMCTMLAVRLIDAKAFVALSYIRVDGIDQATATIEAAQQDSQVDFIDGMFFSQNCGVVCLGALTETVPSNTDITRFSRPWDDWFYINAERVMRTRHKWTEFIPIVDYLFRYDRGAFWMAKYTYRYFGIPCTRLTRWALDRYTHARVMYHALHRSGLSNRYIVRDVAIPIDNAGKFLSFLDSKFKNYPIWVCPLRTHRGQDRTTIGFRDIDPIRTPHGLMLNFGVWGPGPSESNDFVERNKEIEDEVEALGGWKWLYGHAYYSKDQFWKIYDQKKHDALREKYHTEHLPSLYDKVVVKANGQGLNSRNEPYIAQLWKHLWQSRPLAGLYGWWQCIVSEDYLLPRSSWTGQKTLYDTNRGVTKAPAFK